MLVFALGLFAVQANAQSRLAPTEDTLTNADTSYLVASRFSSAYDVVTFQVNIEKVSGTVAGNATIQGSLDNVNFVKASDSVATLTNGDNVLIWSIGQAKYPFYRVQVTTSGTQVSVPEGYVWYK